MYATPYYQPYWLNDNELEHYGILGMKWGVRRYQNADGTLTKLGRARLDVPKTTESGVAKKIERVAYGKDNPTYTDHLRTVAFAQEHLSYARERRQVSTPQDANQRAAFDSRYPYSKNNNIAHTSTKKSNGVTVDRTSARYGTSEATKLVRDYGPIGSSYSGGGRNTFCYNDPSIGAVVVVSAKCDSKTVNYGALIDEALAEDYEKAVYSGFDPEKFKEIIAAELTSNSVNVMEKSLKNRKRKG